MLTAQQLAVARQRLERGGEMHEWIKDVGPVAYAMAQGHGRHKGAILKYIDRNLHDAFGVESEEGEADVVASRQRPNSRRNSSSPEIRARRVAAAAKAREVRMANLQRRRAGAR